MADANSRFIIVEVGAPGRQSDGGTFLNSTLSKQLMSGTFPLPPDRVIAGHDTPLPYYFIGDEAFHLEPFMMRPFPKSKLNEGTKKFNLKLARARQVIECSFGLMAAKFRCIRNELEQPPDNVDIIVKTCCLLHNLIVDQEGKNLACNVLIYLYFNFPRSSYFSQNSHPIGR